MDLDSLTMPQYITEDSVPPNASCFGRVGWLEFGPFSLSDLAQLTTSHSLPDDMEIRIDSEELWWSWPRIVAGTEACVESPLGCLGNWYVRDGDTVTGPLTVADVSAQLLAGQLPSTSTIQIGDGPWRPVTELLVPVEERSTATTNESVEQSRTPEAVTEPNALDPAIVAEQRKTELESWLAKTMPQCPVTVVISARQPTKPLEEVISAALGRVAMEMDEAGRQLSHPWIWGSLAVVVLVSFLLSWSQPRPPDELEVTALRKLKSALEAIQAVRAAQPDEASWADFGQSLQAELDVLKSELLRTKRSDTPIKESLYWALEYRLPRILAEGRLKACPSERAFQQNLTEAERHFRPGAR